MFSAGLRLSVSIKSLVLKPVLMQLSSGGGVILSFLMVLRSLTADELMAFWYTGVTDVEARVTVCCSEKGDLLTGVKLEFEENFKSGTEREVLGS